MREQKAQRDPCSSVQVWSNETESAQSTEYKVGEVGSCAVEKKGLFGSLCKAINEK